MVMRVSYGFQPKACLAFRDVASYLSFLGGKAELGL